MTGARTITSAPRRRRPWGRLRGACAVAALLLSALDHLLTALAGWPPVSYTIRRVAAPITDAWQAAAWRSGPPNPSVITIRATSAPAPERTD